MRVVKVYRPPGQTAPVDAFLKSLEKKLRDKLVWQIFTLARLDKTEMREPHFKHFSLERYSQLYEIREKGTVLVRIVYTICGGDIILLIPFVKRQKRDTEKALEDDPALFLQFSAAVDEHIGFRIGRSPMYPSIFIPPVNTISLDTLYPNIRIFARWRDDLLQIKNGSDNTC